MTGVTLTLLRHAATAWSQDRRIQGRSDPPLSAEGRAEAAAWRLPALAPETLMLASPLARARETAQLLGLEAHVEPRLIEADWGDWEGRRLADLRADTEARVAERERAGLDFHPPGGESARAVQERLKPLLAALARGGRPALAVCHKGVIRAVYALATGWRMLDRPPHRLDSPACHRFRLDPAGHPAVDALNLPLTPPDR